MSMNLTVIERVRDSLDMDAFWQPYINKMAVGQPALVAVHLAVFAEPYLRYVLDGQKTIESRFSVYERPPYRCVNDGDVLLLKRVGGPIVGLCQVGAVWFYDLDPNSLSELRSEFAAAMCAHDPEFWDERSSATFATLMRLQNVRTIGPVHVEKRDRRAWVVLRKRSRQLLLWTE